MQSAISRWLVICVLTLTASALGPAFSQTYPQILDDSLLSQAPYRSAGVVATSYGEGSGAVAYDPRLIYSCAHVVYDRGRWASSFRFSRAYHSEQRPRSSAYVTARGFRYFSRYAGTDRDADFALDFIIAYGTASANFGPALPVLTNADADLMSSASKMILGYPGEIDYTGELGSYHQRRTGPFTRAFSRAFKAYYEITQVSTGPGNSGGPVLVLKNDTYHLAGVLVSGATNMAGIYALNPSTETMASEALVAAGANNPSPDPGTPTKQVVVANERSAFLPDGRGSLRRTLPVRRQGKVTTSTTLDLEIEAEYQGDLEIWLRSPRGRVHWVTEPNGDNDAQDFTLQAEDLTPIFSDFNPNGVWTLFMADRYVQDRARFVRAALTIESR